MSRRAVGPAGRGKSMSKKHFIALAQKLRSLRPEVTAKTGGPNDLYLDGRLAQWEIMRDGLANFCQAQNPNFNRERWMGYIAGENGPSGGKL